VIEIRCPACDADLSEHPLGATHCPVCGEELHVTIDLRDPSELREPPLTVLIADHDREFRRRLNDVLSASGFQVVADVSNGPDAVLVSQRARPMYVFLEQVMRAITGEETARLIRGVSPRSTIICFAPDKPVWADANLSKSDVGAAADMLRALVAEHRS
jgi:CheY-like chemotaxis protein